jgi:hypothetical protein
MKSCPIRCGSVRDASVRAAQDAGTAEAGGSVGVGSSEAGAAEGELVDDGAAVDCPGASLGEDNATQPHAIAATSATAMTRSAVRGRGEITQIRRSGGAGVTDSRGFP